MSAWDSFVSILPYVETAILFLLLVVFAVFRERAPVYIYSVISVFLVYLLIRLLASLQNGNRFLLLQAINILGTCALLYIYYVR